ncbi:hypothetical protein SDJN03_18093, partial [Cucurbita argyrosperma subsp. sororia]
MSVLDQLDLQFLDAPFPAEGSSDVERFFDPPYFEWFQFSADFTEYRNLEECLLFIEDYMLNHEPFDGLLGFSQGATLSAALPGLQATGAGLTKVPKIKFVIIVSGAKFNQFLPHKAFSTSIGCPSLHFLASRKPRSPEVNLQRKPRFLCLHGFRTSGEILKKQLGKWPASVLDQLDLQFLDAPFPAQGSSNVERFFDPPYFEWFQFSADFTEHRNLEECLSFIEDYMLNHEPFDGLLGFSQGATLSAALPGLQASVNKQIGSFESFNSVLNTTTNTRTLY